MAPVPFVWSATGKSDDMIANEDLAFRASLSREELELRGAGTYFTFMESVWDADSFITIAANDFDVIKRTNDQGRLYKTCYENLKSGIRNPDYSSGTANHKNNRLKLDCFGNTDAEAAHLLSHAETCHKAFGYLGEAAVGVNVETDALFENVPGASNLKRRKILVGVKAGKRFTSLKGHKFNKLYCSAQKTYFDSEDPSMILVPCLSFDEVMNWASSEETATEYDCLAITFGAKRRRASKSVLSMVPGECSVHDIEEARKLLCTFIRGVAGCVKGNEVFESFKHKELNNPKNVSLFRWKKLVDEIKANPASQIGIPTIYTGEVSNPVHVGKVRMTLGNSLPDPWLLLVKSAINYSASRDTKLMPACPPLEDEEEPPNTTQGVDDGLNDTCVSDTERASFLADSLNRGGLAC